MLLINRLLLILSLILLPTILEATPIFILANEAYQNKNFSQAINLYRKSLKTSQSFSQHFNLGNAYYENKAYGLAILHYEKALTLEPRNIEAIKNYHKAYEALQIHPTKSEKLDLEILSAYTWSGIYSIVVLIGFGAFCLLLYTNTNNILIKILFYSSSLLSILLIGVNIFYANQTKWGIIVKNDTPLRISPTNSSPITTSLLEGSRAKLIGSKKKGEDFVLVKTLNNKEGWVSINDFKLIWANLQ